MINQWNKKGGDLTAVEVYYHYTKSIFTSLITNQALTVRIMMYPNPTTGYFQMK